MNRTLATIGLATLAVFGLELFFFPALSPLENRLLDRFVRDQAAALAPDPDVVLVDVDEKSLVKMQGIAGRFPWPREVYATLVAGLAAQKPRAIVFDILFAEPDKFRPESDAAFIETASLHDNIFFPMVWLDSKSGEPAAEVAALLGLVKGLNADPNARIAVTPPKVLPIKLWHTAGTINFLADADGVGRRYELRHRVGGWDLLSLPARVAMDLSYPVPNADNTVLAWRGEPGKMPRVSFSDLYEDFDRSKRVRPPDEFKGKIVIIGVGAAALGDLRVTPLSNTQPGSEMLATAIENLKNGRSMRYADAAWPAAIGIALIFLLYFAFQRRVDARATGGVLVLVSGGLLFTSYVAAGGLVLLPVLTPLVAAWSFYVAAALSEYLRERQARREAVAQFSRFVNPEVVKQLIERGGIEGAGQTRQVTLLFSDIRGFTTLSEAKRPEEVVAILNRYFSMQVDVVWRHGGTLDKYIGDCIMALWGAPLDDAQQARNAVACALDMADTLQVFKRELGAAEQNFDVGIGVHGGPAVVGFIGSEKKREYTAIGDTVNLASRIEGLTKDAKRRILVSRDTMEQCADAFDFVSCGTFPVKGRAQPVELFEPRRKT
jgi:adenylate cyclase